jgi:hypothetical protein
MLFNEAVQPGVKAKLGYHSGDDDWVDSGSNGQFISVPLCRAYQFTVISV